MIKTIITHELYKATPTQQQKDEFSTAVNNILSSIKDEVIGHNGSVEMRESKNGNIDILAHCEITDLQDKMQNLLDNVFRIKN